MGELSEVFIIIHNIKKIIAEKHGRYQKYLGMAKKDYWQISLLKRWVISAFLIISLLILSYVFPFITGDTEKIISDITMRLCKADLIKPQLESRISILSIDDEIYSSWEKPFITPREKLFDALEFAVQHKAAVIIIDFDLSRSEHWTSLSEGDKKLKEYLISLDAMQENNAPAIILLHRFTKNKQDDYEIDDGSMLRDEVLHDNQGNVFWANALMPYDEGVVRKYNIHYTLTSDQRTYSAALLAAKLLQSLDAGKPMHESKQELRRYMEEPFAKDVPKSLFLTIPMHQLLAAGIEERKYSRIVRLQHEGKPFQPDDLEGRVVILGAMHQWTADKHDTVIGELYGVEIMANAVSTLLNFDSDLELSGWLKYIYWGVIVLILSLLFLLRVLWLILLMVGLVGVFVYLPLTIFAYHHGILLQGGVIFLASQEAGILLSTGIIVYALFLWWESLHKEKKKEREGI